jgi:hypothetical protein
MAELLDPEGRYFGGRVIAQGVQEAGEDGAPQPLVFKRLLQVRAARTLSKSAAVCMASVAHWIRHRTHHQTAAAGGG